MLPNDTKTEEKFKIEEAVNGINQLLLYFYTYSPEKVDELCQLINLIQDAHAKEIKSKQDHLHKMGQLLLESGLSTLQLQIFVHQLAIHLENQELEKDFNGSRHAETALQMISLGRRMCPEFKNLDYMEDYYTDFLIEIKRVVDPRPGFVYIIQDVSVTGFCKIGRAKNPKRRLNQFIVSLPFDMELLHTIECDDYFDVESKLHQKFKEKRQKGEWFNLDSHDIEWLKSIRKM